MIKGLFRDKLIRERIKVIAKVGAAVMKHTITRDQLFIITTQMYHSKYCTTQPQPQPSAQQQENEKG